jgi:pimeloyl-ACP methyl ester carboxylesterase
MDPVMAGYRHGIDAARRRLAGCPRRILRDPRFGDIEYTQWGQGPAMILSHPLLGGFDMMTGFAQTYLGAGHRFAAASRFGYLGSSLPPAALPADQADACALLLDTLGIDRAAAFGYSGGGPSAIQFALRHPGRTTALILLASALPGKAGAPPKALAQALFGSDRVAGPDRALVLGDDPGQMSWAFALEPAGETSTRLITRSRGTTGRLALGLMLKVFWHPFDFGMQRRQLLNLKRLVETA